MRTPELSIIIVSYNVRQLLVDCLRSIEHSAQDIAYEIIVIDNASTDGSVAMVRKSFPHVQVIANQENAGFARANNQGYEISKGKFILLLNPDTVVRQGSLNAVLEFMRTTADAGMVGCRLLNPDGSLQKSIRKYPSVADHIRKALFLDNLYTTIFMRNIYYGKIAVKIDYAAGAFLFVRRAALEEMHLLNPLFFMYAEEKDLALRLLKRGWFTYFVPFAEIVHYGGQSTSKIAAKMFLELQRSQVKYFVQHYKPAKAYSLALSWWLVLLTNLLVSIPLVTFGEKDRLRLFTLAFCSYPRFIKEICWDKTNE